jgi:anaerobic magnesium-protoporphyrin IX monomethyl ester cyclase
MNDRLDLLLVYPPWPAAKGRARLISILPPLGVLSIAANVEQHGHSVVVCDAHAEQLDDHDVRLLLRKHRPRFVGLSVLTSQVLVAHVIARIAKEEVPDCVVVAGGVHAEVMPVRMLRNSAIDLVIRGDGEQAMVEILEGKPFDQIAGASHRKKGSVVHNAGREVVMDLDVYPMPAYHLVDFDLYYPGATTYRQLPAINLLMIRGCPGKCTFCNSAKTTLRTRSPASMVAQIKHLYDKYGIRQFQFYDDTFTVMKKTCLEFCALLTAENLDVSWIGFIRGDCFSDQIARAMKGAGCHQVLMGVETGSAEIAERIGKPIDHAKYKRAVEIAHDHGLEVRASFIIGSLGETWETMQDSLDMALELDFDFVQLFISTPYPGTAMYKEAVERGWLREESWDAYGQARVLVDQPQIDAETIYRFERHFNRRFYLRQKFARRMFKRSLNPRHLRDYALAVPYLLMGMKGDPMAGKWACWANIQEADHLDLDLTEPNELTLTYTVRTDTKSQGSSARMSPGR